MNSWPKHIVDEFWASAARAENGCLEWAGFRDTHGYGRFRRRRHRQGLEPIDIKSHRAAFWLANGSLPGLVRHTCDNPPCVDPNHLLAGTHADNSRDALERDRLVGHPRRLSDETEDEVRALYARGGISYRALAAQYDVSFGCIQWVMRRGECN